MYATQRREDAIITDKARLRREIYNALTHARGARSIDARAELFGLHRSTVVRIEQGQIEPSLGVAMGMAHALGVGVETLWLRRGETA